MPQRKKLWASRYERRARVGMGPCCTRAFSVPLLGLKVSERVRGFGHSDERAAVLGEQLKVLGAQGGSQASDMAAPHVHR